jgi:hypothetical protein
VNPNRKKSIFQYDNHMPETDDHALIVLKGHLLVEKALFDLIHWALPHPQYLDHIRLGFQTLTHVVRAAVPHRSDDVCWELILKLNSIRNDFAHNLEPPKLQNHLAELFKIDEQIQPSPGMPLDKKSERSLDDAQRLRHVVIDCLTFLHTLAFDYQEGRVPR